MNKLLQKHSMLLTKTFDDYGTYDFYKELAAKVVTKHRKEIEASGDFKKFLANNENLLSIFNQGAELLPLTPVFEKEGTKLVLKSARFFEISRYAIAVSTFIKGVDQFVSAEKILESKQYQFIVFAYYSSIFQLLTSFLALHGIVYIPKSSEGHSIEELKSKQEDGTTKKILKFTPIGFDKFTKGICSNTNNEWAFSYIGNDHTTRWKEFCDLLKTYLRNSWENQIPEGVVRFWGYIKVQAEYNQRFWDSEKKEYEIAFADKNEFINALNLYRFYPAKIRHQKIYEDRHFDLFAWAYFEKKQSPPDEIKNGEQDFFRDFAKGMVLWQHENLKEAFDFAQINCKNKEYFYVGMNAIADTPDVKILEYLRDSLYSEKILYELKRTLPDFINMLFV